MLLRLLGYAGALMLAVGCGRDDRVEPDAQKRDAGTSGTSDAGHAPAGTFDTARPLTIGDFPGVLAEVEGREDVDFFSFEGKKGQWVTIRSSGSPALSVSDTTLALYDPERQPLAWNGYVAALQGEDVLARIVTRLPEDGTYYLSIGDPNAAPVAAGFVQPYEISVVDASTVEGYTVDVEAGNDASTATPASFHHFDISTGAVDDGFFLGDFSSESDVDAFSFEIVGGTRVASARIETVGVTGNGSTTLLGNVWASDESGVDTIAKIDNSAGQNSLSPPLPPGNYRLFVAHPTVSLGGNDFYVMRVFLAPDNPLESADATNGTLTEAEPLVGDASTAYIVSHLGENDVDYFRFDSTPGSPVSVQCTSSGEGSGVVGFHVSVRDETDVSLVEADETALSPVDVQTTMPTSGQLFLRETKASQLADVTGDWARCFVSLD